MKLALAACFFVGTCAQGTRKGPAPPASGKASTTPAPNSSVPLDPNLEKMTVLANQVQDVLENTRAENNGQLTGTVVDLVLQTLEQQVNATCDMSSREFKVCVEGYQSLDCVYGKEAATFGGVNCIPYLSQCMAEYTAYCRSKVANSEKCRSTNACDCANEIGCGWSRGHMMCLTGRPLVSCGDCPTLTRCGAIDCGKATRPCDCVALGGLCGWSTSSWRCESGKDTDCNECKEQMECGGPGVALADSSNCPATKPAQLSPCSQLLTCPYDKKCCDRCAGAKQVCNSVRAQCDGQFWEIITSELVCPDCDGYYYDDGYYDENAPTAPQNVTVSGITANSATIAWKAPADNFKPGTDGYSVAYALNNDDSLKILNLTTKASVSLTALQPNTNYKVSILPVVTATEEVGEPAHVAFRTLPAGGKGKKAKVVRKAVPKAAVPKAKSG